MTRMKLFGILTFVWMCNAFPSSSLAERIEAQFVFDERTWLSPIFENVEPKSVSDFPDKLSIQVNFDGNRNVEQVSVKITMHEENTSTLSDKAFLNVSDQMVEVSSQNLLADYINEQMLLPDGIELNAQGQPLEITYKDRNYLKNIKELNELEGINGDLQKKLHYIEGFLMPFKIWKKYIHEEADKQVESDDRSVHAYVLVPVTLSYRISNQNEIKDAKISSVYGDGHRKTEIKHSKSSERYLEHGYEEWGDKINYKLFEQKLTEKSIKTNPADARFALN